MEVCEACGGSILGTEPSCPHCEINLGGKAPSRPAISRNPIDGSPLPSSGIPIVSVQAESLIPEPTMTHPPPKNDPRSRLLCGVLALGGVAATAAAWFVFRAN
jgi:hypothetical protein